MILAEVLIGRTNDHQEHTMTEQRYDPTQEPQWNPVHETWDQPPPYGAPGPYAPQHAAPEPPPRKKPWYKRTITWVLVGLFVLVAACAGAAVAVGNSINQNVKVQAPSNGDSRPNAFDDVKIGKPTTDKTTGWMKVPVTVTNHDDATHDYVGVVSFLDKNGEQLDTANITVQSLDPGQTAHTVALTLSTPPAGGWKAKVSEVTRI